MSFRIRVGLLVAAAVAVTVLLASGAAWLAARSQLRGEVDQDLLDRARVAVRAPGLAARAAEPLQLGPLAGTGVAFQLVGSGGTRTFPSNQEVSLPVDERDLSIARGAAPLLRDADVGGRHLRLLTAHAGAGTALQIARPLAEVDASLAGLASVLLVVVVVGVGLALAFGLLIARGALAPIARLTEATERVATTEDLEAPIAVERDDEIGRLASSFNAMLAALAASRRQQRRLVADASHELRTPLTSLRTNIEVLARTRMKADDHRRLLADVTAELEDLSSLVAELVELAADPHAADEGEVDVRLDELVAEAVDRARRRSDRTIETQVRPTTVRGRPTLLARAIGNLLDNAAKWGAEDEPIEVRVADGRVEVGDRGPGIAEEDRERVFDRFYRSPEARGRPGSGLGLAIVRQVAEAHGGRAWAAENEGGGALVGFELPELSSNP